MRRYEHPTPVDLLHVDVKKCGRAPAEGEWRIHGRGFYRASRARRGTGNAGHACVHASLDDRFRLVYSGVHEDETSATVPES